MDDTRLASGIDHSRQCMPEHLTPLFHTAAYAWLTPAQRLRYNQLQACSHNELTMFFEVSLAHTFLPALIAGVVPEQLGAGLRQFIAEEERHIEMFSRLNRRCAPALYRNGMFHFLRKQPLANWLMRRATASPRLFPLFAWLMLIQEERSAYFSTEVLNQSDALEPHFVKTHRAHLADETGHVRWDEQIIERLWGQRPRWLRALNARLLGWMLNTFFCAPYRQGATMRVLDRLLEEFPSLRERGDDMRRALLALGSDEAYRLTLYARAIVPKTYAGFDRWPEFACLDGVLPGYQVNAGPAVHA